MRVCINMSSIVPSFRRATKPCHRLPTRSDPLKPLFIYCGPWSKGDCKFRNITAYRNAATRRLVRETFTRRDCEKTSQAPPAPFRVNARGWAGPSLLAMV